MNPGTSVTYDTNDDRTVFAQVISASYPKDPGIESWQRTITHDRGSSIMIEDTFQVSEVTGDFIFNLITPCNVTIQDSSILLASQEFSEGKLSGSATIEYDSN